MTWVDKGMRPEIVVELVKYKSRMLPFMPGRRTGDKERAFLRSSQLQAEQLKLLACYQILRCETPPEVICGRIDVGGSGQNSDIQLVRGR